MYGVLTYISHKNPSNVGKYTVRPVNLNITRLVELLRQVTLLWYRKGIDLSRRLKRLVLVDLCSKSTFNPGNEKGTLCHSPQEIAGLIKGLLTTIVP